MKSVIPQVEESSKKTNQRNCHDNQGTNPVRDRFKPKPVSGLILKDRDNELLADLLLHRVMTRGQIQDLYFNSVQRCNDRLRKLFDWGYLTRYYMTSAPYGSQAIYSIGKAGLPKAIHSLAQMDIELNAEDLRIQSRRPSLSLLDHALAIVDVYIAFRKAFDANNQNLSLNSWLPERLCREEYDIRSASSLRANRWHKEVFNPDGFMRVNKAGDIADFFFEIDLGHTNSNQFTGKIQTHNRMLESGIYHDIYGQGEFKTLIVTTSLGRIRNLLALTEKEKTDLYWYTTFDTLKQDPLGNIWQVPFQTDQYSIVDALDFSRG